MNYQVFFSRIIFSLIILILFFVSSTAKTEIVAIFGEDGEKGLTATGKKRAKNGKVGEQIRMIYLTVRLHRWWT